MKIKFNFPKSLLIAGVSTSLILTSSIFSVEAASKSSVSSTELGSSLENTTVKTPVLLAQADTVCNDGESTFITAETSGFWVGICGGDNPYTYVGVSKKDGKSIRLPLQRYSRDEFVAVNKNTRYVLTPKRLRVTQGRRVLVNQAITSWN